MAERRRYFDGIPAIVSAPLADESKEAADGQMGGIARGEYGV